MKTVGRALRTILRSPPRTGLLVAVPVVSIGLTLVMITVNEAFGERLDEIKGEDRTVVVATHDEAIAAKADLIMEMSDGRLVSGPAS